MFRTKRDEGRGDKIRGEYDWKVWNILKFSRF